jgi:amphi-Trp domain-containing protein
MGIERVLFKSEEKKSKTEIATVLRTIADKLESGSMMLKQDVTQIDLEFPDQMVLELKVEEEQGRRLKKSLEIELEWIVGDQGSTSAQII